MTLPPQFYEYTEDQIVGMLNHLRDSMMLRLAGRAMAHRFGAAELYDMMISSDIPAEDIARAIILYRDSGDDMEAFRAKLGSDERYAGIIERLRR